jgi:hypothetical protein
MAEKNERTHQLNSSRHEPLDLSVRGILIFFFILGGMMAVAGVIVTITLIAFTGHFPAMPVPPVDLANAPRPTLPPAPRLEAVPGLQLQELRANEDKQLHTYGWVDQKAGVVHIPIDRAMELLLQRGLPARPAEQNKFQDQGTQSPSDSSAGREMEKYP